MEMPKAIAEGILAVMSAVGKLAKTEKNTHANYSFAGVDDFLSAVNPACVDAGIFIAQDEDEFEIRDGWLVLHYEFTVSHKSGVVWDKPMRRSIMVNAKMGAQAFGAGQSYALKQFMRSLFQIATGDKEDADSHEQANLPAVKKVTSVKRGATKIKTTESLHISVPAPDDGGWPMWRQGIEALLDECAAHGNVKALYADNKPAFETYAEEHPEDHASLGALFTAKRATFEEKAA